MRNQFVEEVFDSHGHASCRGTLRVTDRKTPTKRGSPADRRLFRFGPVRTRCRMFVSSVLVDVELAPEVEESLHQPEVEVEAQELVLAAEPPEPTEI